MKNILIVCAMEKESLRISKKLELENINSNTFRKNNITLLITGIGKQMTAISLIEYLCNNEKPDIIVNIGYAGSTDIQIGKWVNITRSYNYEWEIPGEEKYVMLAGGSQQLQLIPDKTIEQVECYSAECFVTETDIKDHIAFDMELHSLSIICDKYDIPLLSMKKISDNLCINNYYQNIETEKEVFELESCLDYLKFLM